MTRSGVAAGTSDHTMPRRQAQERDVPRTSIVAIAIALLHRWLQRVQ